MRGQLTEEIIAISKARLGYEISQTELRLMPYIHYMMLNEQRLDPNKVNSKERKVLSKWRARGWIEGEASEMSISREFWDAVNEILWHSYVLR